MANIQWQTLILKVTFWMMAEIVLGLVGLDELADFGEFLSSDKALLHVDRNALHAKATL